jgi:hypothetical protein
VGTWELEETVRIESNAIYLSVACKEGFPG